jgi:hypothetical protein
MSKFQEIIDTHISLLREKEYDAQSTNPFILPDRFEKKLEERLAHHLLNPSDESKGQYFSLRTFGFFRMDMDAVFFKLYYNYNRDRGDLNLIYLSAAMGNLTKGFAIQDITRDLPDAHEVHSTLWKKYKESKNNKTQKETPDTTPGLLHSNMNIAVFDPILKEQKDLLKEKGYLGKIADSQEGINNRFRQYHQKLYSYMTEPSQADVKNLFVIHLGGHQVPEMNGTFFQLLYDFDAVQMRLNIKALHADMDGFKKLYFIGDNPSLPPAFDVYLDLYKQRNIDTARKLMDAKDYNQKHSFTVKR